MKRISISNYNPKIIPISLLCPSSLRLFLIYLVMASSELLKLLDLLSAEAEVSLLLKALMASLYFMIDVLLVELLVLMPRIISMRLEY